MFRWAFGITNEQRFVSSVLERQPAAPVYFAGMKRINKLGPHWTEELTQVVEFSADLLAPAFEAGRLVVALRPADEYAAGHIPGIMNLPMSNAFLTWVGWLLPLDRPFALLGDAFQIGRPMYWTNGAGMRTHWRLLNVAHRMRCKPDRA